MLYNHLLFFFRNIRKNKTFSFLNIFGLAIGIACASLIFLWVEDELTFNHNFEKRDNLYRVMANQKNDGKYFTTVYTPAPMAAAINKEIPGIKNTTRLSWIMNKLFVVDDKNINVAGMYADPSILSMLGLKFIHGANAGSLIQPNSIVISETMAKMFFGNDNPVGKFLKADSKQQFNVDGTFIITGVFKDLPKNCSYKFQWLSPFEIFVNKSKEWMDTWVYSGTETLVELEPATKPLSINKKLKNYLSTKVEGSTIQCFLFSMNDWNLYNQFTDGKQDGGNIIYVKLFSLIAVMILFIACVNFMNLATARSQQRAKEVGVRKVLGSGRSKLIFQFLGESILMSLLAVLVAICILYFVTPSFNLLVQKDLSRDMLQPRYLVGLLSIGLITGLFAGIYPAFYLSSFRPVIVLKGSKIKTGLGAMLMRRGLVIAQFSVSIILIICTIIIYQQVQHVKNRDLGFNKDNLVWMLLQGKLKDRFSTIRSELINSGAVENAALSGAEPLHLYAFYDKLKWQRKVPDNRILVRWDNVSPEYVPTMQMEIISGRNFYSTPGVDSSNVIINESMAKVMGAAGKPGSVITRQRDSVDFTIVGIIKDFVYNDMYASGMPMLFHCDPQQAGVLVIALKQNVNQKSALIKVEGILKANNPGFPFDYFFVDDEFNKIFTTETLIEKLAFLFAILAIFVSCLGLFGLAAYTAERRTKEVGIRKVLGASVGSLAKLLSLEFLKLVSISCIIAFPIAWWALHSWLKNYQYRTSIQWWVFLVAGLLALLIAILTVSYQAVKVAIVNPVKSLRTE